MIDGLRQVLWGLFKKIVIADQVASLVNQIFENYQNYSGAVLLIGAVLFSIQIYCDFSGYTDIALGSARMLGFELLQNFNYPYFSRNLAEFWRRWHISLSSWFRDYLYIPLGGSKVPFTRKILNVFIIFVVSGFWHGANWTFIMWGLLNAIFVLPSLLTKSKNNSTEIVALHTKLPSFYESIQLFTTFSLVCLIFIVFRAPSITMSYNYYFTLFTDLFNKSSIIGAYNYLYWEVGMILPCLILLLFLIEWVGRKRKSPLTILSKFNYKINFFIYTFLIMLILFFSGKESDFIYFQF
jgi:D-alanyl-lipoteichoic acid acyltransferase DltB (MBOAT superfamily)